MRRVRIGVEWLSLPATVKRSGRSRRMVKQGMIRRPSTIWAMGYSERSSVCHFGVDQPNPDDIIAVCETSRD